MCQSDVETINVTYTKDRFSPYDDYGKFKYIYTGMDYKDVNTILIEYGEVLNNYNSIRKNFWSRLKWLLFG